MHPLLGAVVIVVLVCAFFLFFGVRTLPVLAALLAEEARWLVQRQPLLVHLQCDVCGARRHVGTAMVLLAPIVPSLQRHRLEC